MISAIIAEYNPFHNGHLFQLNHTKQFSNEGVVVIMSGNFVQRAQGAIVPKEYRVKAALSCGADLVVELPLPFATGTAQKFAYGSVFIAMGMGCIDRLCMGSEIGEIPPLKQLATILNNLPPIENLKANKNYAALRESKVEQIAPNLSPLLKSPNNILAVEYIRAIELLGANIQPVTVKREGVGHNDKNAAGEFASATTVRDMWRNNGIESIKNYLPNSSYDILKPLPPFNKTMFEEMSLARLRTLTLKQISQLPDISEGLENRVYEGIGIGQSYPDILEFVKSKRYSMARVRRIVLSAVLGITAEDLKAPPPYIRILGVGEKGAEILAKMKKTATLPFSHSLSKLQTLGNVADRFATLESSATDLYNLATTPRRSRGEEYRYRLERRGLDV